MINRICYAVTKNTVPYENLALEELLLHTVEQGECILYLWQNQNTVVIGRNQNCRGECRVAELEKDGGYLARRLSGGGAVFHDLGNLNFTFLVHKEDYDLDRQLEVILRAVRSVGISAEKSGRNDITCDGRKFSGNAFYTSGTRRYHHGTIMIDANLDRLSHYLTVAPDKLAAKGVKSVRSRVVNLSELNPAITVECMKDALIAAFGEVYELMAVPIDSCRIDSKALYQRTEYFASEDWRIGCEPDYTAALSKRFGWGGVELRLTVSGGTISQATVYTDAMDADLASAISCMLTGVKLTEITDALSPHEGQNTEFAAMVADVAKLIKEWS